nr:class I SAM-dependent methyltransferase [Sulfitobacter aestuariivivens]
MAQRVQQGLEGRDTSADLTPAEVQDVFKQVWKPGYGSVAMTEVFFIDALINTFQPQSFLEVGTASGLSTGLIARSMEANGGGQLTSLDYDDTFFGDTTKPNGFLFPDIYKGASVRTELLKFKTSPDLLALNRTFDMAFVDANHQHPWPTIDMMCIWPYLTGPKIMVHHDLNLFLKQEQAIGIGPKYVYDQFGDARRMKSTKDSGNIFALDLDMPQAAFERILMDLFKLPWSLRTAIQPEYLGPIRKVIETHYSQNLLAHFDKVVGYANVATVT